MPTDLPRFESNERVDLTDFEYSVDEAIQGLTRHLNEEFLTDPDGATKSWILDGFAMADLGGGQLQVTKGRAILAQREGSEIHYGALTTEGDATKTLDLSGYGNATYNIYIRFQYVDAETQSRMFWNPSGSGTEFAQSIQTRRQANWSLRVELASPGDEWVQIGTVQIVGGAIGGAGIVDQRNLYFEGSVSGAYANTWGGGNDRNADRQQYGIKDLQTFTAAVRTLFEDLRPTGGRWWEDYGPMTTEAALRMMFATFGASNWTERDPVVAKDIHLRAVASDRSIPAPTVPWVAVGEDDVGDGDSYILSSTDGSVWAGRNPTVAVQVDLFAVAHDQSGLWVTVGANSVGPPADSYILTSTDGVTWTERAPAVAKAVILRGVAHNGAALWVTVGDVVDGTDPYILESSDGGVADAWAAVAPTVAKAVGLNAIAHNQTNLWCAVGDIVDGTDPYILTSPDGLVWTQRTPAVAKAIALNGVAYDSVNELWCAVGDDIDGSPYIITSTDAGVSDPWVRRTPVVARAKDLYAVAHDQDSLWCAVGEKLGINHHILTSPDGIVWEERGTDINANFTLNGIARGSNGVWVAVGNSDGTDPEIFRSLVTPF